MDNKTCPKCGARWFEGNLYWATGKPGKEEDLAGLVCRENADDTCINPKRHVETGDTWEKRREFLNKVSAEMDEKGAL